jgi:uncharacterized protein (UPF0332 family)
MDAVVTLRIQQAKETYNEINTLIANGFFRTAANRLYYACYYVVTALMIKTGHQAIPIVD